MGPAKNPISKVKASKASAMDSIEGVSTATTDQHIRNHTEAEGSSEEDPEDLEGVSVLEEGEEVIMTSARKIPKRRCFNFDDDFDDAEGGNNTLVNTEDLIPLDFDDGDGGHAAHITRTVVVTFFQKLTAWRRNTNHTGPEGTEYRNNVFLSPDVRGWLANMAGDPHSNSSGKEWRTFTDQDLRQRLRSG